MSLFFTHSASFGDPSNCCAIDADVAVKTLDLGRRAGIRSDLFLDVNLSTVIPQVVMQLSSRFSLTHQVNVTEIYCSPISTLSGAQLILEQPTVQRNYND